MDVNKCPKITKFNSASAQLHLSYHLICVLHMLLCIYEVKVFFLSKEYRFIDFVQII